MSNIIVKDVVGVYSKDLQSNHIHEGFTVYCDLHRTQDKISQLMRDIKTGAYRSWSGQTRIDWVTHSLEMGNPIFVEKFTTIAK